MNRFFILFVIFLHAYAFLQAQVKENEAPVIPSRTEVWSFEKEFPDLLKENQIRLNSGSLAASYEPNVKKKGFRIKDKGSENASQNPSEKPYKKSKDNFIWPDTISDEKEKIEVLQEDIVSGELDWSGNLNLHVNIKTGAFSVVEGNEIFNMPVQSMDKAIQGRAAGVHVLSSNGIPGGSAQVLIRGMSSILASNQPLYIVDGVQLNTDQKAAFTQTNPLAFLNINDIASIEVLKDAGAAAIYGMQGANGVILITTKKGQAGKTQIQFNAFGGSIEPIKTLHVMDPQTWYNTRKLAWQNSGNPSPEANALNNMGILPQGWQNLSPEQLDAVAAGLTNYDWQNQLIGNGNLQQYELSISGGDNKNTYRIAGSFGSQGSTFDPVDFQRGTLNMAFATQATNKLRIENFLNLSTIRQEIPFAVSGSFLGSPAFIASTVLPHNPIFNEDGSYNTDIKGVFNQNVAMVNAFNSGFQRGNSAIGNLAASYQINKNLVFKSMFGLDYRMLQGEQFRDPRTPDGQTTKGRLSIQSGWNANFISTQTLHWYKQIKDAHFLSILAGVEYRSENTSDLSGLLTGFPAFEIRSVEGASQVESLDGASFSYRRAGVFGAIQYDFKKKYFVQLTGRYEGNSRFAAEQRFGFFPSISGAWSIKEEGFLKNSESISTLRLRGSYGQLGNDRIGNFTSQGAFMPGGTYGGNVGLSSGILANNALRWETVTSLNAGFDFGIFSNKLFGGIDLFERTTSDLILEQQLLPSNGSGTVLINDGELVNRGIEFTLGTAIFSSKKFHWEATFNYATLQNEVTKLIGDQQNLANNPAIAVGQSLGTHFTQEYAGVNPATGRAMWFDAQGNITYLPTANDRVYLGNSLPRHYGGLMNTFKYKGFEVGILFNYEYGRVVSDGQYNFLRENASRLTINGLQTVNRRMWQEPGQITDIPRPYIGGREVRSVNMNSGSASLLNADFIRLRQLSFAYVFNEDWIKRKLCVASLRLFAQGVNLWTYTSFPGYDPEFTGSGIGIIPQMKNYSIGIQVGF